MSLPPLLSLVAFMAAAITSPLLLQPKKANLFFQTRTHSTHLWRNITEPQWKKQGKKVKSTKNYCTPQTL